MVDEDEYCREIESYLCRKNHGHLIRIVGPAFEQVCGWARQGVPLKVAFRGIDRYCERHQAKGPRRRPVRIEFCEADILESFDEWRRAMGAVLPGTDPEPVRKRPGLAAHIERVVARLTGRRGDELRSEQFRTAVESLVQSLDSLAPAAVRARGDARANIVARLAELDGDLLASAEAELDAAALAALRREADEELLAFGSRLPPDVRERAGAAAFRRLLRDRLQLPIVSYDQ